MKRTHIFLTDDQHAELARRSQESGKSVAEHVREAVDWHLGITGYTGETIDKLKRVHPEMTPSRIVEWLMFRWRLDEEGKSHKNGNGDEKVIAMLTEILEILKHNDPTDYTDHA